MACHASTWAGVGVANAELNQDRVTAEKPSGSPDAGCSASGIFLGLIRRFCTPPPTLVHAESHACGRAHLRHWMGGLLDLLARCRVFHQARARGLVSRTAYPGGDRRPHGRLDPV